MTNVPTAAKTHVAATATSWMTELLGVAVEQARRRLLMAAVAKRPVARAPEHAADAVDGEDVERVVDLEPLPQQRRAK